jgi:hypothetical protein
MITLDDLENICCPIRERQGETDYIAVKKFEILLIQKLYLRMGLTNEDLLTDLNDILLTLV